MTQPINAKLNSATAADTETTIVLRSGQTPRPELARERGIENAEWVTVSTPRGAIECKALVTKRMRPFDIQGRTVHQVGMPWHWGYKGVVTGDVVNDLSALVGDPNVTSHEAKVFVCRVSKV